MRIAIHFEKSEGKLIHHATKVVDSDVLDEEMNAVENGYKDDKAFRWVPERALQKKLIEEALPDMYVDPLVFSWPFRRAVIETPSNPVRL